jgi:ribulokinase
MANYLLGIDFGTGGAKACVIDENANPVSYAFREYPIINDKPGWSEHDGKLYWTVCCELIKECLDKGKVNPEDIKAIGTSSACPSTVFVNENSEPVTLAYNLMDRRATKEVQWLKENIGEDRIFDITANRLEDHPMIVNLMWEKNNRPDVYKRTCKVLTIDGYIRLKLTGKATVNYSNGAFYGVAYNVYTNEFDEELLKEIDIDINKMPEAFACEAIIGEVTDDAARECGLVPGIPVPAGQTDCNAGWVGAGAVEPGDIQMNLGTCGNFGIITKDTNFLKSMINFAYTTNSTDTYITVPTTTTGGQSLRFLRDNFSPLEVAMEKLVKDFDAYDYLNMEAEKIAPGCDGLVVLPYLMGERTPIWDVDARGVVFGLSLNHTKAHLVRAMMEAVAFALYDSFCIIRDSGYRINYPIVLNEGGAKSRLWRQIITDVFNVPTVLVESRIGAPYGDALLAGVSIGIFSDFSIAKEKASYVELMEPSQENHKLYMEYFNIYKSIYCHLKEDFKELARVRGLGRI